MQTLFIIVWMLGALVLVLVMLPERRLELDDRSKCLETVISMSNELSWALLNLVIKTELWRGPEKFAGLASKLLHIEREMVHLKIPTYCMFKVRQI